MWLYFADVLFVFSRKSLFSCAKNLSNSLWWHAKNPAKTGWAHVFLSLSAFKPTVIEQFLILRARLQRQSTFCSPRLMVRRKDRVMPQLYSKLPWMHGQIQLLCPYVLRRFLIQNLPSKFYRCVTWPLTFVSTYSELLLLGEINRPSCLAIYFSLGHFIDHCVQVMRTISRAVKLNWKRQYLLMIKRKQLFFLYF